MRQTRRFLCILMALCLLTGLVPNSPITVLAAVNGYGSTITYAPQMLNIGGSVFTLLDGAGSPLAAVQNMSGSEQRKYLKNNGYALNKFGTLTNKSANTSMSSEFDFINNLTDKGKIEASYRFFDTESRTVPGNIISAAKKNDFSFSFAYNLFLRQYDSKYLTPLYGGSIVKIEQSTWCGVSALGDLKWYDGSKGSYTERINYTSAGKLSFAADAWKPVNDVQLHFSGDAVNGGPVDTELYDAILLGKDSKGPKILSVDVSKTYPGSHLFNEKTGEYNWDGFTGKRPAITVDDIGKRVYVSVQFDEPVKFKDNFVSAGNLENMELIIQTLGKDGGTAQPAAAKFLSYAPATDDAAPVMIFEYLIQDPSDPQSIRKDQYFTFDKVIVSPNENSNFYNNLTDMAGNPFGLENGVQPPTKTSTSVFNPPEYDSSIGNYKLNRPVVDLEPFVVEDVVVTPIYKTLDASRDGRYLRIAEGVDITVNLNKQLVIKDRYKPWESLPAMTTNVKHSNNSVDMGYIGVNTKESNYYFTYNVINAYNFGSIKAVATTTRKSDNSPLRTSITYHVPFPAYVNNIVGENWKYSSEGPIKLTSLDLSGGGFVDSSGYELTIDPAKLEPDALYYVDMSAPTMTVDIAKPQSDIIRIKANASDNTPITSGSAVFDVTTDIESNDSIQYQRSVDGSYNAADWEDASGKSFSVSSALMASDTYLIVKIPSLAQGSKLDVKVTAMDNAGNTGTGTGTFAVDYDTVAPKLSLTPIIIEGLSAQLSVEDIHDVVYEYAWIDGRDAPEPAVWSLPETITGGRGSLAIKHSGNYPDSKVYEMTLWVRASDTFGNPADPISVNCSYNAVYGIIDVDRVSPADPNEFIFIEDTAKYPDVDVILKNITSYSWQWVRQGLVNEVYSPETILNDLQAKDYIFDDQKILTPDDDPDSPGHTNNVPLSFALTPDTPVGTATNMYINAFELNRPVFLALRYEDENGGVGYKVFQFNTLFDRPNGDEFANVRFSTNDKDGKRYDRVRYQLNPREYMSTVYRRYDDLYQYDDIYTNFNWPNNRIDTIFSSTKLNAPPLYDFAEVEFTLQANEVTGIKSLDLDHSDGIGTKVLLKKVVFTSGEVGNHGFYDGQMIWNANNFGFYQENVLSAEIIQEWDLTEAYLKPLEQNAFEWDSIGYPEWGYKGHDWNGDGMIDYRGDYTFVLGVDLSRIDPAGFEYYEENGQTKFRLIRYEFSVIPVYANGVAADEKPLSMYAFQNSLQKLMFQSVTGYLPDGVDRWGNPQVRAVEYVTEPLAPYAPVLAVAQGGIVTDNSNAVPRVMFQGETRIHVKAFMPLAAEYMLSMSSQHYYQMNVGSLDEIIFENGTFKLDKDMWYGGQSDYDDDNFWESMYTINLKDVDDRFDIESPDYDPKTGDKAEAYYQLVDTQTGLMSQIYRMDFIYDDTPPIVVLDVSETRLTNGTVTVDITSVYDGHFEGVGIDEHFVVDTPREDIVVVVEAKYNDGTIVSETNGYVFERNGKITVTATDAAGNTTVESYTVSNIDRDAPTIIGTPIVDQSKGKFTLNATVPDTDAISAFVKFDADYTAHLTGGMATDTMFSVNDNAVMGAAVCSFDNGEIHLEVYAKDGVQMKTATLLVYDEAGNACELILAQTLNGVTPTITNANKTYEYGGSLDFSVPVRLLDMASNRPGYSDSHGNLPIYSDMEVYVRYMDLFNREFAEVITADIFGVVYRHHLTVTPTELTNGNVTATIDTQGFPVTVKDSENANLRTIAIQNNGNFSYTIVPDDTNIVERIFTFPVTNIDKTPPIAIYRRVVNGTETFDEQGRSTVVGSVTYTIRGFDKKDVSLVEGEADTTSFSAPGSHTFSFVDAAGNTGTLHVSEEDTIFMSPADMTIAKYRLTFTTAGENPVRLGWHDSDEPMINLSPTNKDISVLVQALNAAGDVIPSGMEMTVPISSVKYYLAQNTVVFTADGTTTVKLKTSSNEMDVVITIPNGTIIKTAPTGSVKYVMLTANETYTDGTEFKKGAIKAYLIEVDPGVSVAGDGVLHDSEGYFIYFEENGSGIFYLTDAAGNVGTVIVGAYGIDMKAPDIVNESWYSNIAAKAGTADYTSGNGKNEVLSTITNNSIRLFFTFDELLGNVEVTAYTQAGGQNIELPNTSDYITYFTSGNTLLIEFKQNCQARIVVSDILGNSVTLWRPEDGPITVIDKDAPVITGQSIEVINNKVHITYNFDEDVTSANEKTGFANTQTVVFDKNGVYPLTFADRAWNVVSTVAVIDQIDDLAPVIYYAIQIVPGTAGIVFSDAGNTQVEATNGNVEIAVAAVDVNNATIRVINRNKPSIPMPQAAPTITANAGRVYSAAVTAEENGIYQITAVDDYGNTNTVYVKIDFIDKTVPIISVTDTKPLEIVIGTVTESELRDLLLSVASAKDDREGTVPVTVDISGVNVNVVGSYSAVYEASDSLGNANQRTRTVAVLSQARQALLINGRRVAANDAYNTAPGNLTVQCPDEGYRLYAAEGFKTRAQMKDLPAMQGKLEALKPGYYTIMAQNSEFDTFMVFVYVY